MLINGLGLSSESFVMERSVKGRFQGKGPKEGAPLRHVPLVWCYYYFSLFRSLQPLLFCFFPSDHVVSFTALTCLPVSIWDPFF